MKKRHKEALQKIASELCYSELIEAMEIIGNESYLSFLSIVEGMEVKR